MKFFYFFILNLLIFQAVFAQTEIDVYQTFGEYTGTPRNYSLLELFDDGKFLTAPNVNSNIYYNGNPEKSLIRFNSDGTRDKTFNIGTGFTGINGSINSLENRISSLCIQSDYKILVAGLFTYFNGIAQKNLIRLNPDGTKDIFFNIGTGFTFNNSGTFIKLIKLQPDGKILLGGGFTSYNNIAQSNLEPSSALIRLNPDGTKDATFDVGTGFYGGTFTCIKIQPDGKILVGGDFTSYKGITANRIIRLNSDGTIDSTFNAGIGFDSIINSIEIQIDGKVLVSGNFTSFNGLPQNRIIRLNPNGTKDTSFDVGLGIQNLVNTFYKSVNISCQSNGKILVDGPFTSFNGIAENGIIRLNSDGTKDTSFIVGNGFAIGEPLQRINTKQQQDNKIIAFGNFTKFNDIAQNGFVRINIDGSKDETFLLGSLGFNGGDGNETGNGIGPGVGPICIQSDGKLIVGGSFTSFNGITENKLIRFNSEGKKDDTFNIRNPSVIGITNTGFNNGDVLTIAVQTDGKILVGGTFTTFNNVVQNRIIRLNNDGTKDSSFNIGSGFDGYIHQILLQPDGKILVTGPFTTYNGVSKKKLVRLNQNGTLDSSLIDFSTLDYARIALQSDGKILIGSYNGALARLNPDGTNDVFFNVGSGLNNAIGKIIQQPDNKILVGGYFSTYNGLSQLGLIRFNTDGSKDTTFNLGGSGIGNVSGGGVSDIAIQSDGKILICGGINDYNGITQQGILRIMPDGSLDTSFIFGDSSNSYAFPYYPPSSIALKNNGVIFVGGKFRNYFNYASSGLVGIRGNAILSNQNFENNNNVITLYPNPVVDFLNFQTSESTTLSQISIFDLMGKQILKQNIINNTIDIKDLSKGIYLIKIITSNNEVIIKKIIKN